MRKLRGLHLCRGVKRWSLWVPTGVLWSSLAPFRALSSSAVSTLCRSIPLFRFSSGCAQKPDRVLFSPFSHQDVLLGHDILLRRIFQFHSSGSRDLGNELPLHPGGVEVRGHHRTEEDHHLDDTGDDLWSGVRERVFQFHDPRHERAPRGRDGVLEDLEWVDVVRHDHFRCL